MIFQVKVQNLNASNFYRGDSYSPVNRYICHGWGQSRGCATPWGQPCCPWLLGGWTGFPQCPMSAPGERGWQLQTTPVGHTALGAVRGCRGSFHPCPRSRQGLQVQAALPCPQYQSYTPPAKAQEPHTTSNFVSSIAYCPLTVSGFPYLSPSSLPPHTELDPALSFQGPACPGLPQLISLGNSRTLSAPWWSPLCPGVLLFSPFCILSV